MLLTALLNGGTPDTAATRPDASMPGGSKPNPSRLNSLAAYLIDVQRGWLSAAMLLDNNTLSAAVLRYGDGLSHGAIATAQGCSTSTARRRCERWVGAVLANMNGKYFYDDDEENEND